MKTLERKLANKIADHWYNELHMQHKPIFQKQKLADFVETELKTLGLFSVSNNEERVTVSCSSCKWMQAKYDYKCDRCTQFQNYEQDTDC